MTLARDREIPASNRPTHSCQDILAARRRLVIDMDVREASEATVLVSLAAWLESLEMARVLGMDTRVGLKPRAERASMDIVRMTGRETSPRRHEQMVA